MLTRQEIAQHFLQIAAKHGAAYSTGNYKLANKLHKKLHELYDQAKLSNCQDVFKDMIDNEDESIQLWAAIFTLKLSPQLAETVLARLAENSNIKMTAQTTLTLWRQDKLNLL